MGNRNGRDQKAELPTAMVSPFITGVIRMDGEMKCNTAKTVFIAAKPTEIAKMKPNRDNSREESFLS